MLEKRKHPRQAVDLNATVSAEGVSQVIEGKIRDLSIGGMFFLCEDKVPFGAKVTVQIHFPKPSGTLAIPAVVRWVGDEGVGLQFGLTGARETHAIAQVLRSR